MRVLLDTHVFLWWVGGTRKLPSKAAATIRNPDNICLLSLASIWELAIKVSLGKLTLAQPVERFVVEQVAANTFETLEIRLAHLGQVERLPRHHGDPFDRLLIAQSLEEELSLVTADPVFRRYGIRRIWS
ncbi:MAG: type II toxin-antitoxin system VapC family toxin [Pseudomonadota bacterium]